jgi:hypothetical protein
LWSAHVLPVAAAAETVEFAFVGLAPVAYHAVLGAFGVGVAVALYAALRRCGVARSLALASALAFGLGLNGVLSAPLPNDVGLALFFLSLHAGLSVRGATRVKAVAYAIASLLAGCAAALCSTLTLPLFVASAVVLSRRSWSSRALGGAMVAAMLAAAAIDAVLGGFRNWFATPDRFADGSIATPNSLDALLGISVGLAAAGIVFRVVLLRAPPTLLQAWRLVAGGCFAFVLGLVAVAFGDRAHAVADVGVAMATAGAAALVAGFVPGSRTRAAILAAVVGVTCGISQTNGAAASDAVRDRGRHQVRLVADVVDRTAGLPRHALVLIGGTCPNAPFASGAEVTGALRLVLDRADVRAELVSASTRVERFALVFHAPNGTSRYRLGRATLGYDASTRAVRTLANAEAARRFVADAEREGAEQCS